MSPLVYPLFQFISIDNYLDTTPQYHAPALRSSPDTDSFTTSAVSFKIRLIPTIASSSPAVW
jgi:hypothetical protein